MNSKNLILFLMFFGMLISGCTTSNYDVIIKNGTIYDGSGQAPFIADIGINADTIAAIGNLESASAPSIIDAQGMAVSPGFINMLSWGNYSLLNDGRSLSGIKQGVTLEVFGEGSSMGPVAEGSDSEWTTLGGFLDYITEKGVTPNVASFVGATTIRTNVLGRNNVKPTDEQLLEMQEMVREAMREGALGLGTSLIYAPAFFADTEELIALSKAAAEYNGRYISHIRSEGDKFLEAVDELLTIATEAEIDAEFYHLKAAGKRNWDKLSVVVQKIDSLRSQGYDISANMYTYTAASTGLDATLPPWSQEGSTQDFLNRLNNPEIRSRILREVRSQETDWENFYQLAGEPENILLLEFNTDSLKKYTGKTLAEVSAARNTDPVETILELLEENRGDIGSVYFLMSEENVRRQIQLPYMTFGSDARSVAAEGDVLNSSTHPRTYGNFARLLGKYVRDEGLISLEEAIYRLTQLPAQNLKIRNRGLLRTGYFADIVIFDPQEVGDKATFEEPHQYSVGVRDVFVNGTQVLNQGEHTGEMPGQAVRGPGFVGN
ncbi:MAG: D-aminoacylase [Balneolaceae bacterium]